MVHYIVEYRYAANFKNRVVVVILISSFAWLEIEKNGIRIDSFLLHTVLHESLKYSVLSISRGTFPLLRSLLISPETILQYCFRRFS